MSTFSDPQIGTGTTLGGAHRHASVFSLHVEEIDNGMLVTMQIGETAARPKKLFINDLSELSDLLTSQLAAHRIGV